MINKIDLDSCVFESHNYTGMCPQNVYEINPIEHNCGYECMYCLVNNGVHSNLNIINNYSIFLEDKLVKEKDNDVFFYYSPKSEAFQNATLETGVAHNIIKAFIKHYEMYPNSGVRLFIASKAGINQLSYKYKGDSIIHLLSQLTNKVQFNGSIGLMPEKIRIIIEKNAPSITERLEAMNALQNKGIISESVLLQPIITTYCDEYSISELIRRFSSYNIKNIKPEFLTTSIDNIYRIEKIIKDNIVSCNDSLFLNDYIKIENRTHVKHNDRLAPDKKECLQKIRLISKISAQYDISISICNWVRKELNIMEDEIAFVNHRGYQCLGYNTNIFNYK